MQNRLGAFLCAMPVTVLLVLAGCSTVSGSRLPPLDAQHQGDRWWSVRFRMSWPEDEPPRFYLDALLADRVAAPALRQYRSDIDLWRFHRRAARDRAGHQFSVLMYTDQDTARAVFQTIRRNGALARVRDAGAVRAVLFGRVPGRSSKEVRGSSDSHWPVSIQRSWPWFIMGVSQSWLSLIEQARRQLGPPAGPDTAQALIALYKDVDARVETQWREFAAHAYLHHLNALFGYQGFRVRDDMLMRF